MVTQNTLRTCNGYTFIFEEKFQILTTTNALNRSNCLIHFTSAHRILSYYRIPLCIVYTTLCQLMLQKVVHKVVRFRIYNYINIVLMLDGNSELGVQSLLFDLFKAFY